MFGNPFCHVCAECLNQFDIYHHLQVRGSHPGKKVLAFKSGRNRPWFLLHTRVTEVFLKRRFVFFSTALSAHESARECNEFMLHLNYKHREAKRFGQKGQVTGTIILEAWWSLNITLSYTAKAPSRTTSRLCQSSWRLLALLDHST